MDTCVFSIASSHSKIKTLSAAFFRAGKKIAQLHTVHLSSTKKEEKAKMRFHKNGLLAGTPFPGDSTEGTELGLNCEHDVKLTEGMRAMQAPLTMLPSR